MKLSRRDLNKLVAGSLDRTRSFHGFFRGKRRSRTPRSKGFRSEFRPIVFGIVPWMKRSKPWWRRTQQLRALAGTP